MLADVEATGQLVRTWLDAASLNAASVARRAGVSPSTLHRVLNDRVDPSVGTLAEIALACGLALDLATAPLSDRLAAAAARVMLEDGYKPPDDGDLTMWQQRLVRWAGKDDPLGIVQAAAHAASPLHRAQVLLFSGEETLARLASAGDAANGRWALSGAAGLDPGAAVAAAVTILWCDDPQRVSQMLANSNLRSTRQSHRATVAVVGAEPELFYDSFSVNGIRFVAPIQIVLDSIAQGGAVAKAAIEEAATW
jgi:transcriptional regulator with XRE-family HTH domain